MGRSPGGRKELRRQLEENPDWESDLLALYGFDIWDAIDGRAPIRRAYSLISRLGYEPKSIWRAKQLGSELETQAHHFGWDSNSAVLADVYDAVNQLTLTLMSVNSPEGAKLPELEPYPRPGAKAKATPEKPKESLDDFASKLRGMFGPGNV